jgi:hypothetical protein
MIDYQKLYESEKRILKIWRGFCLLFLGIILFIFFGTFILSFFPSVINNNQNQVITK